MREAGEEAGAPGQNDPPANDFEVWLAHMGRGRRLPDRTAAEMLGLARNTVQAYRTGRTPMPRSVALACAALTFGLPPWRQVRWD
jgi:hypothetical protein